MIQKLSKPDYINEYFTISNMIDKINEIIEVVNESKTKKIL
jgi:hypothetical protein